MRVVAQGRQEEQEAVAAAVWSQGVPRVPRSTQELEPELEIGPQQVKTKALALTARVS